MRRSSIASIFFAAVTAVVAVVLAAPAFAQAPIRAGEVRPMRLETPHPYALGTDARKVVWTDRVISPGAEFVRVHFSDLNLAPGDYLTVSSPDGAQVWTYRGRGPHQSGDVWALAVAGDTAIVRLYGGRGIGFGYVIDAVGHGTMPFYQKQTGPVPEVICGTNGVEDVACYATDPALNADQKAVARLSWIQGAYIYACTGWLAAGANASTMVTNNHCFSTQRETETVQALFNFQSATCGGTTAATTTSYTGGTFLKTNSIKRKGQREGLDYTLFTLLGNPEATWGELTPSNRPVAIGDPIWFIQHPGGNEKKVGVYEDGAKMAPCNVDDIGQTYGKTAIGSQTAYACDSEGGSSGSPILASGTDRVIALHHFGGVATDPCLNSGTAMAAICADAGALLSCAAD
jgi:V8-like Glu-specific endopeptidase